MFPLLSTEQKISVPQKSFASRFSVGLSVRALFRFILSVLVVTDDSLDLPNGELWSLFAASHLRLQMSECRNQSLRGEGEREKDGDSFDFRQISEQFRLNLDLTDILRGFWGPKMTQILLQVNLLNFANPEELRNLVDNATE